MRPAQQKHDHGGGCDLQLEGHPLVFLNSSKKVLEPAIGVVFICINQTKVHARYLISHKPFDHLIIYCHGLSDKRYVNNFST